MKKGKTKRLISLAQRSTNTYLTLIDIVFINLIRKSRIFMEISQFQPRSSLLSSHSCLMGSAHKIDSTHSSPFKRPVFLRPLRSGLTSKVPITRSRLSLYLYALKELAVHLLHLYAPAMEPGFGLSTSTTSSQAVSLRSTIFAQCCLISVFK